VYPAQGYVLEHPGEALAVGVFKENAIFLLRL
jgi:hypothetical protein